MALFKPDVEFVIRNPWRSLRRFTGARIALGRTGVSLPTRPLLEFQLAHARARDAVHQPFDIGEVARRLVERGFTVITLHSQATDRLLYLRRPDFGRRLDQISRDRLRLWATQNPGEYDVVFVIADGLSAPAIHGSALPLLDSLEPKLRQEGLRPAPVVLVEQGRVAVGDEVGQILAAGMAVVLIGERPGLSSPDSLGLYLTYRPQVGRTDAERNCISNVRQGGLGYGPAAHKLLYLMLEARRRRLSGVNLKDEAAAPALSEEPTSVSNFLIED